MLTRLDWAVQGLGWLLVSSVTKETKRQKQRNLNEDAQTHPKTQTPNPKRRKTQNPNAKLKQTRLKGAQLLRTRLF